MKTWSRRSDGTTEQAKASLRSVTDVIGSVKAGLPVDEFDHLCDQIGVTRALLIQVISIKPRTLARRRREGRLQPDESDRLYRIQSLYNRAVQVLGDPESARRWLKSPRSILGGRSPLEYADTEVGAHEVEDLLGRLEYGVFS